MTYGGSPISAVGIPLGSMGATSTLALASSPLVQATGTLTANCALTVTGMTAGCYVVLQATQDATGGRTLTINGHPTPVAVVPNITFEIELWSPDGVTLLVRGAPSVSVVTVASSATPTLNTGATLITVIAELASLAANVTSFTTNLMGTPVNGQALIYRITDNGTARTLSWGSSFEASTVALPTTTVPSTLLTVGFFWNAATSKWRCVAVA